MNYRSSYIFIIILSIFSCHAANAEIKTSTAAGKENQSKCFTFDDVLSFRYKAHCTDHIDREGHKVEYSFNGQGIRDHDYSSYPKPNTQRILMLGSSATFGSTLAVNETVPKVLEKMMNARRPTEVINAGIEGYMILQNVMRLEDYLKAYHPQKVLLVVTDQGALFKDYALIQYAQLDNNGVPIKISRDYAERLPKPIKDFLYNRKNVYFLIFTIEHELRRIWSSIRLKWQSLTGELPSKTITAPLIPSLLYAKKMANKYKAEFLVVFIKDQNNNLYLGPYIDQFTINFLYPLEFNFSIPVWALNVVMYNKGINTFQIRNIEIQDRKDIDNNIESDGHLNAHATEIFTRYLAKILNH